MTRLASSKQPGAPAVKFLSIAAAMVLIGPSALAQAPPMAQPPAAPAPLEAYTDPGWTGRPQPIPVLRKEAAAALAEGRRRCAAQADPEQKRECLRIVSADYRLMMSRVDRRTSR